MCLPWTGWPSLIQGSLRVDIVQAVGRAIRLSDGKVKGTIIIPVFISDDDDPDIVLSSSEFDKVWKVVKCPPRSR